MANLLIAVVDSYYMFLICSHFLQVCELQSDIDASAENMEQLKESFKDQMVR